jgi:hypothetical protein
MTKDYEQWRIYYDYDQIVSVLGFSNIVKSALAAFHPISIFLYGYS